MNLQDSMTKYLQQIAMAALLLALIACGRNPDYVYELNKQQVEQQFGAKEREKTAKEFISIAYSDLFGRTIGQQDLEAISLVYAGIGDKTLMEDMIVKDFLNEPAVGIPNEEAMRSDPDAFITEAYEKLFNRVPTAYELWYLNKQIEENTTLAPDVVYYGLMTSDEYRFY